MTGELAFLILLTLIAALVLVFVIRIDFAIRAILNKRLPAILRFLDHNAEELPKFDHVHVSGFIGLRVHGVFIVWEWRAGRWHCLSQAGAADPGVPPSFSGAFEGDVAKTWTQLTESSQSSTRASSP
ncbi:hypothetical protein [Limnoglobus roseus]|uniref:Uncharacterized protein n=1 Tax=Limnoglobus roseus TaxID=2598579 RepID=A0A5C1AGW2_9BACT|nr:hypothetical protein [Limnoglobus roseus]QEL18659.1 hypothetical protein PX52LOC_05693 [Limnoglobus roseus]